MPTSTTTAVGNDASVLVSPEALESNLFHHLATTAALDDLHATLLASLQRAGWTERVRALSLELLRAGRCECFDDVVEAVVALAEGRSHPAVTAENTDHDGLNGVHNDPEPDALPFENIDVRIPRGVAEQGVKTIKEALREVIVIEDDGDAAELDGGERSQAGAGTAPTKKKEKEPGDNNENIPHTTKPEKTKPAKSLTGVSNSKNFGLGKEALAARLPVKSGESGPIKKPTKERKPKASSKDTKLSQVRVDS
ncbi:hypothetical protein V8E54_014469 [Elaphomyces granulatus]